MASKQTYSSFDKDPINPIDRTSRVKEYLATPFPEGIVLLIGSTGSGKSTLGNLLVDPPKPETAAPDSMVTEQSQYFTMASDTKPETQLVQTKRVLGNPNSIIIDTPGLDKTDHKKELRHMTDIIKTLAHQKYLLGCLFVTKWNAKIDRQYEETMKYYGKLLPDIFEAGNVVLVMTHYAMDKKSVKKRKEQGVDVSKYIVDTTKSIRKCIPHMLLKPDVVLIDSFPDADSIDDEYLACLEARNDILNCLRRFHPIVLSRLKLPKIPEMIKDDKLAIHSLEYEIKREIITQEKDKRLREEYVIEKMKKIEELQKKIEMLKDKYMTVEEAENRLQKLCI